MRFPKLLDGFSLKSSQVHAVTVPVSEADTTTSTSSSKFNSNVLLKYVHVGSKPKSASLSQSLLRAYGLPSLSLIEPPIEPHLKPLDLVQTLADIYFRLQACPPSHKASLYIQQHATLRSFRDPKLLLRCLRSAHHHSVDLHTKVVLSAWLQLETREDELVGFSTSPAAEKCKKLDCLISKQHRGCQILPPLDLLTNKYKTITDDYESKIYEDVIQLKDGKESLSQEEDCRVVFCIGDEEVTCIRSKIAALSPPFAAMLYGNFMEAERERIDFTYNGISVEEMRAIEVYSRTKSLASLDPAIVLKILSFANKFCCEEMKSSCDAILASLVHSIEDALILIDHALEESAYLLVASCLQVILRGLPNSLYQPEVMKIFSSSGARGRLAAAGHDSFLLYYFLSQVAMEHSMVSDTTLMLLERLRECGTEMWQKVLALHQLGCVMLHREDFLSAECYFEAAAKLGQVYSMAGVARAKYLQGQQYSAYRIIETLVSKHKPVGWMYQERSLYNVGSRKISDVNAATELDPTLPFPYKFRAVAKASQNQIKAAISEMDKIIGFKLLTDCLELRAWFLIALADYQSASRDIKALLSLEPNYMMFAGKVSGNKLLEILNHQIQHLSQADCWVQLYETWSSVDDIGSLAVIHQMLDNEPKKSLLWFRKSLLLLRLNHQKAAMRCLWFAHNLADSEHERLVYEGWILYDLGYREEALSAADKSIAIHRSFEGFFLKAYVLADASLDSESVSYVIKILKEALSCPSDGLRKGQALNNLASIYVDCDQLELASVCYMNALEIKHTRAHQGLARVRHLENERKAAYDEMTMLIEKAKYKASAYEKRSEYCNDREKTQSDLNMATQLDPLRTYPYRYKAAVLMDEQKEAEAVEELTKAIEFKPDLQMLHLRAAFFESMGNYASSIKDCAAALCLDPTHVDTLDLYSRSQDKATQKHK